MSKCRGRILVIDDDVDFVSLVSSCLQEAGYQVSQAYQGREGLGKVREEKPDLIILDVMMESVTEGLHLSYDLRADPRSRDVPILLVTSLNRQLRPFLLGEEEAWLPVQGFLEKPVDMAELVRKVEELLRCSGGARKSAGGMPKPEACKE